MMTDTISFLSRRNALALLGLSSAAALLPRHALAAGSAVLAWTPGMGTPQISVALKDKLWAAEKLDIKPVSFPTGREALEALLGGGAQFASLAEFPVVTAALRGQKFVVLTGLSTYVGNRIVINAARGAKDIASLAGRKVGVTLGTNMQFLADAVLKGIKVDYVNVAPGDLVPALARGEIDAAFMFNSFYPQAKAVLGKNYVEVMTPQYQGQMVIVAGRDYAQANPAAVKAFLAGLLKAVAKVAADTAAAIAAVSAATGGALSVDTIDSQWSELPLPGRPQQAAPAAADGSGRVDQRDGPDQDTGHRGDAALPHRQGCAGEPGAGSGGAVIRLPDLTGLGASYALHVDVVRPRPARCAMPSCCIENRRLPRSRPPAPMPIRPFPRRASEAARWCRACSTSTTTSSSPSPGADRRRAGPALEAFWMPLEAAATAPSVYASSKSTFLEALRSHITTIVDHGIRSRELDGFHPPRRPRHRQPAGVLDRRL